MRKNWVEATTRRDYKGEPAITTFHNLIQPDSEAFFAMALIERWAMVAAVDDGEDSAGRAKLRLSTPDELVDRAFTLAKLTFDRIERDDLVLRAPPEDERERLADERENRKENRK